MARGRPATITHYYGQDVRFCTLQTELGSDFAIITPGLERHECCKCTGRYLSGDSGARTGILGPDHTLNSSIGVSG